MLRTTDEYGKTLELCLFPLCADDPVSCHPLIPRSLRAKEFPGGLVGAKLLFLLCVESGALPLLVRVDGGLFCSASGEGLETGGMHQALLCELLDKLDVDGAPGDAGLSGIFFVEADE